MAVGCPDSRDAERSEAAQPLPESSSNSLAAPKPSQSPTRSVTATGTNRRGTPDRSVLPVRVSNESLRKSRGSIRNSTVPAGLSPSAVMISPCAAAWNARVAPQVGQLSPVIFRKRHGGSGARPSHERNSTAGMDASAPILQARPAPDRRPPKRDRNGSCRNSVPLPMLIWY